MAMPQAVFGSAADGDIRESGTAIGFYRLQQMLAAEPERR